MKENVNKEIQILILGSKFRNHKKLIMPSFGINNLKEFLNTFNAHAVKLVEDLGIKLNAEEFDVHPFLKLCTMNVLLGNKTVYLSLMY